MAIEEEKLEHSVICYTDESYVNVRHKIEFTWFSKFSTGRNEVGGGGGRGEREILLHAITRYGLLGGNESPNSDLSQQLQEGKQSSQHFFMGGYT